MRRRRSFSKSSAYAACWGLRCILLRVGLFEFESESVTIQVGAKHSIYRPHDAIEQLVFNTDVIVEILEMAGGRNGATHGRMNRWGRVSGHGDVMGVGESGRLKKSGDAGATCRIDLQDVNGARIEHSLEI